MEANEYIEIKIWEYIDNSCTLAEREQTKLLLATNTEWKRKYDEISAFNLHIATNLETEQPSLRFSKNVMEEVATTQIATATNKYIKLGVIKGIAAFFIIMISSLFIYSIATTNWNSIHSSISIKNIAEKINLSQFKKPAFSSGGIINIVIGFNVVLALIILDKVLRKNVRAEQEQ